MANLEWKFKLFPGLQWKVYRLKFGAQLATHYLRIPDLDDQAILAVKSLVDVAFIGIANRNCKQIRKQEL